MHVTLFGNAIRIIREQTRQKDARRKAIPTRIRWFSPETTETIVFEIRPDSKLRRPKVLERTPFFRKRLLVELSLRTTRQ